MISVEQAKIILAQKDVSSKEKYELYMRALHLVAGSAFKVS